MPVPWKSTSVGRVCPPATRAAYATVNFLSSSSALMPNPLSVSQPMRPWVLTVLTLFESFQRCSETLASKPPTWMSEENR
jgi:hypothetical protein